MAESYPGGTRDYYDYNGCRSQASGYHGMGLTNEELDIDTMQLFSPPFVVEVTTCISADYSAVPH